MNDDWLQPNSDSYRGLKLAPNNLPNSDGSTIGSFLNPAWGNFIQTQVPKQPKHLAHCIQQSLNIVAPRLIQRIPANFLPGTTTIYPNLNIPSRITYRRRTPLIGPQYDQGSLSL